MFSCTDMYLQLSMDPDCTCLVVRIYIYSSLSDRPRAENLRMVDIEINA